MKKIICKEKGCRRDLTAAAQTLGDPFELIIRFSLLDWHKATVHDAPMPFSGHVGLSIARYAIDRKQLATLESIEHLLACASDREELSELEEKLRGDFREIVAALLIKELGPRLTGGEMTTLKARQR